MTDIELLQRYRRDGQSVWLGELYNRYSYLVFGVCLKYLRHEEEARDATLAIFEKLVDALLVQEILAFQAWLYRVTKNHCLKVISNENKRVAHVNSYMHVVSATETESSEELLLAEWKNTTLEKLEDAISNLAEAQRDCVRMFYLDEKSYIEITESTGYSLGEVKSYIQNGKRNLRMLLTGTE